MGSIKDKMKEMVIAIAIGTIFICFVFFIYEKIQQGDLLNDKNYLITTIDKQAYYCMEVEYQTPKGIYLIGKDCIMYKPGVVLYQDEITFPKNSILSVQRFSSK